MEILILILKVIGLTIIGFFIAEFQNAYLSKHEKSSIIYFSIIGVLITQKDIQRLFLAFFLSIAFMISVPEITKLIGYNINSYFSYIAIGYTPSTVLLFVKKKVKEKIK